MPVVVEYPPDPFEGLSERPDGEIGAEVDVVEAPEIPDGLPPDEGPYGPPPILEAGIDLETYAAPPVSNDPETRLASGRRPIPLLRDARAAIRSAPKPASGPESQPGPQPGPGSDEPSGPGSDEPPGPGPAVENPSPAEAARAEDRAERPSRDDVRPVVARPAEPPAGLEERNPDPLLEIETPSPSEPARPRWRLLNRVRQLRERLTGDRDRDAADPSGRDDDRVEPVVLRRPLFGGDWVPEG